ncbi:fatty acid desaturase [Oleiphilus messinensis]|uniref:Fatty acid desaturase n=1 Tax=Oleiphilus messinensis TaxID=141451 RepID=A0A1Y0IGA6_9GAMM|nr:fatty acid desaturase family protein [Oleiphilus messinensis]ARU59528.1 fatty acid desaturase [Oleiphilus messinensis]
MTQTLSLSDYLSKDEIKAFTARSDVMGWLAIITAWSGVALIFWAMALASQGPLWVAIPGVVLGSILLAGRQLALSIIVHDAAHGTLFKTRALNYRLTDWLCARPLWNDLAKYRVYHLVHHTRTGTEDDPDLILRAGYPTTRASLTRKFLRDLSGIVGLKYILGRILMDAGVLKWTVTGEVVWLPRDKTGKFEHIKQFLKNSAPMVLSNLILFSVLALSGHGWLYLCWVIAHLTFFMLFMRIRSMAEHGDCERSLDMFKNTRSMRAGWLVRALVAPIGVNYHMEHHLLASCPYFRLKKLHNLLRARNAVPEAVSYGEVIKMMSRLNPQGQV